MQTHDFMPDGKAMFVTSFRGELAVETEAALIDFADDAAGDDPAGGAAQVKPCRTCAGTGWRRCGFCHGCKTIPLGAFRQTCPNCQGTGTRECRDCHGTGDGVDIPLRASTMKERE